MKTIIRHACRHACGATLALLLGIATPAAAHHVVWADFSAFALTSFGSVNGNTPPTRADQDQIEELIIAEMQKDLAAFDIHLSRFRPLNGRYTRVRFLPGATDGLYGCAGADCCPAGGNCTGIGSWKTRDVSACEVYAGSFAANTQWQGGRATAARIGNALARTGSHELGHILGLTHCHGYDDFPVDGSCRDTTSTADANIAWHVMTAGPKVPDARRATQDFFYTVHASRRALYGQVQPRNHAMPLPDFTGDGRADLVHADVISPEQVRVFGGSSSGNGFASPSVRRSDAGEAGDLFYGVGRDLVQGHPASTGVVPWRLFENYGGDTEPLRADVGNVGNVYRWGDVDGDGRPDLVTGTFGRTVSWTASPMNRFGTGLGAQQFWSSDAGDEGDLFFVTNVTDGDILADLVAVKRDAANVIVSVRVYQNTGAGFVFAGSTGFTSAEPADYVLLDDVDADGEADLVVGRVRGDLRVDWFVGLEDGGSGFLEPERWAVDRGDAGDLFRLGDGDGDGMADLFFARPTGLTPSAGAPDLTTLEWFGARSTGASFDSSRVWRSDAGQEGSLIP